jgi:hypothetical protein
MELEAAWALALEAVPNFNRDPRALRLPCPPVPSKPPEGRLTQRACCGEVHFFAGEQVQGAVPPPVQDPGPGVLCQDAQTVSPNFATQECQWLFGERPVPLEEDPTFPRGCLAGCESSATMAGRKVAGGQRPVHVSGGFTPRCRVGHDSLLMDELTRVPQVRGGTDQ